MEKRRIYLDHGATTPVKKAVFEAMKPYLEGEFGNPSSLHQYGAKAGEAIKKARMETAKMFGCDPCEIIFTSGATEANNLAIKGLIEAIISGNGDKKPHVITTAIEHDSVLKTIKRLAEKGIVDAGLAMPEQSGKIDPEKIRALIKPETVLISVMSANNETGMIQPVMEIGEIIKKANIGREKKIIFHTDAVQAANFMDISGYPAVAELITISGHKMGGPKGIGALYKKAGVKLIPLMDGGDQENKMRAGTENVPAIAGLGEAVKITIEGRAERAERIKKIRDGFIKKIMGGIPDAELNGDINDRLPNNANLRFKGAEGEAILALLDAEGIAVSTGSACAAASGEPSHVLLAMGLSHPEAHGSVRFTLGEETTEEEMDIVFSVLQRAVKKLREISGSLGQQVYWTKN